MIRPVTCFLAFLSLSIFYAYGGKKYLVETNDEEANGTTPVDGKWNDWGSWSACHNGMRYRFRKCNNPPPKNGGTCRHGKSYQEEPCLPGTTPSIVDKEFDDDYLHSTCRNGICREKKNSDPCIRGCEWGPWSGCGVENTKTRRCGNPPPSVGAKYCRGLSIETVPCHPGICKTDYDCHNDGMKCHGKILGTCYCMNGICKEKKKTPCKADKDCYRTGMLCEILDWGICTCRNGICVINKPGQGPVDGNWSKWGPWSACSNGGRTRTRRCDNPPPSGGGKNCPGLSDETVVPCPLVPEKCRQKKRG